MNDHRAAGQELQSQVLAAARKGQERVHSTVKNVRAAADQIRPQLANLPKPNLPTPAQLRERAPQFVANLPAQLQTRLPKPDQLRAGAEELAGHARSVRRVVVSQVASVAAPLAQQAATRLAQIGEPAPGKSSSGVSKSRASSKRSTASSKPRTTTKSTPATNAGTTTKVSKVTVASDSKPAGAAKSASSAKPKAKPADK